MKIAQTTDEQRAIVDALRADAEQAEQAEQKAREDKKQIHADAPPEWVPMHLRSKEQNKVAGARKTLGQAEPTEGEKYEQYQAAVADAEERQREAKADTKRLRALLRRESRRLQEFEAREAAGVSDVAGAFADLSEALTQLHDHDPAAGKRSGNFDRDYWTKRAQAAFDYLNQ